MNVKPTLLHPAPASVESKAVHALDQLGRVDLPRHKRVELVVRLVGGVGQAAKIAQCSRSTIVNWRKDGANQPVEGLLALALAANVSLDWLAGGDDERRIDRHLQSALQRKAS